MTALRRVARKNMAYVWGVQSFFRMEPSRKYAAPDRLRNFFWQEQDERSWKKAGQANTLAESPWVT